MIENERERERMRESERGLSDVWDIYLTKATV